MDYYNGFQNRRSSGGNTVLFVILFVLLVSSILGVVAYLKYDDIVVMFEDSSPSPVASESPSSAESKAAIVESSPDVGIGMPYTTNGTKNLGETCDTNNDCKSSFARPMVCKAQTAGETKQCRKLSVVDGGENSCYIYQCNLWMKKNLKKRFDTTNESTDFNHACYKCFGFSVNSIKNRANFPDGNNPSYKIGYSNFRYNRGVENGVEIGIKSVHEDSDGNKRSYNDMKKLYQRLCIKSKDGTTCNPDDTNIDSHMGYQS